MRIIAGSRKSLRLKSVPGNRTRPTTDRIKETLFNIIGSHVGGSRFLDVFAGSGGIGIEALSRGASHACFVESARAAASVIRENIRSARFEKEAEVICAEAPKCFRRMACAEPYSIVFMDPPYRKGLEAETVQALRDAGWIDESTLCIAEAAIDDDTAWTDGGGIEVDRIKDYKTNRHIFFHIRRTENEDEDSDLSREL